MFSDTIAAVSTASAPSGIGIVRMSGKDAFLIADKVYKSPGGKKVLSGENSHTIHYGYICDGDEVLDEVLVMLYRNPRSYTTEDMVEIDCHGGIIVLKRILELLIRNGARPAEPGEFTKRAFVNGRMDLSKAEAVIDIINSKNELALKNAISQLQGNVKEKILDIRQSIINDVAFIEAAIDDPEHINAADHIGTMKEHILADIEEIEKLIKSSDEGRMIKDGIRTVIIGKPNAGKSSVLNTLMGMDRAIVTDIAGTTRDTLEEYVVVGGIPLNLVDTAGIHESDDTVEKIGIDRAKASANDADLVIYIVDASKAIDEDDRNILSLINGKKCIVLLNKTDLNIVTDKNILYSLTDNPVVEISALTGAGIEEFKELLKEEFFGGNISINDEVIITNLRHKKALMDAKESLLLVIGSINACMPEDFYSIDLMEAYNSLGAIVGETADDDLIDTIFSNFCMGK